MTHMRATIHACSKAMYRWIVAFGDQNRRQGRHRLNGRLKWSSSRERSRKKSNTGRILFDLIFQETERPLAFTLLLKYLSEFSFGQIPKKHVAVSHAVQLQDRMAGVGQHTADHPVLPLLDGESHALSGYLQQIRDVHALCRT